MKIKVVIAALLLVAILPVFVFGALGGSATAADAGPAIKGTFTNVPGQTRKFDGNTVEVVEFLSFYCDGCYKFEKAVPVIRGTFPKKIKWKILPIYWGSASSKPGEAYLLAEDAGKGAEMKKALFNANFVEKKNIGDVEVLDAIAGKIGLGFDFSRRLRAGEKAREAAMAIETAKTYGVNETPTLIIAGDIMASPHTFNHDMDAFRDNVITILRSILKQ